MSWRGIADEMMGEGKGEERWGDRWMIRLRREGGREVISRLLFFFVLLPAIVSIEKPSKAKQRKAKL